MVNYAGYRPTVPPDDDHLTVVARIGILSVSPNAPGLRHGTATKRPVCQTPG